MTTNNTTKSRRSTGVKKTKFKTSKAVLRTMANNPATNPMGFDLNSAKQLDGSADLRMKALPLFGPDAHASFASNTVQSPASIVELARALNVDSNGPQLMYEHVYNNMEWEPGWGVQKGALGCLMDGMGNSFDQSLLLANLLRQAGFTANIILGAIRLTEAQYQAWWNVTDIWGAQSYCLNEFIPIVTAPTWNGTTYYMDIKHVWVAWVNGATTYYFDPSYKSYSRKTAMSGLSTALGYNATTFMSNAQSGATVTTDYAQNMNRANIRSDLQTMTANLVSYIKSNTIGSAPAGTATVDDILGGQTIVPTTIPVLNTSLSYQMPGDVPTVWTGDVPSTYKPTLQVQFPNWSTPGVWDFTYQTTSDNLANTRLTLWYDGSLVPSLYLNGTSVATGLAQPSGTWTSIFLTVTHPAYASSNYPLAFQQSYQTNWAWWQQFIYAGGSYLIANAWGNLGQGQMDYHQTQLAANQAAGGAATAENVMGEKLAVTWYSWAAQNSKVADLINRIKNCHTMYSHQVGVISYDSGGAVGTDLGGVRGSSTSLANDTTQTPINDTVLAMHGVALEAAVCSQMTGLSPGVSTTTLIDAANTAGNKIYKGTSSNWNTGTNVENILVTNGYNSTDMSNLYTWYIQWGDSVVIPDNQSNTLGSWSGWGYWDYPVAGAFGIINGGFKGGKGQPGDPNKPPTPPNPGKNQKGQPNSKEPIGLFTGDYFYDKSDISVGSGDSPYNLGFGRFYNSAKQFTSGPLGRGWSHTFDTTAKVGSDGMLAMADQYAIPGACTIAELFVTADLVSDTTRPVSKLVTMTLADAWWVDQIFNNTVVVSYTGSSQIFVKQPDGSYSSPLNNANKLTLAGGLYTLTSPHQDKWNFDSSGNLSTIVYPYGVTITLGYTSGKLTSVTNGLGRTLTLSYTGNNLSSVSDGTGRTFQYSVDASSNLVSVTNPDSKITTFEYDIPGRLTKIFHPANPSSPVVINTYDTLGKVKQQTDAYSNVWNYYFAGSRSEEIDPAGNALTNYYNRFGSPIRQINQVGKIWTTAYDGLNRMIECVQPEGNKTQYVYDLNNNATLITAKAKPGSGLTDITNVFTYHSTWNKVVTAQDGRGNTTTHTWNATTGTLTKIELPAIGGFTPTVSFTYNSRGQVLTRTDETGIVSQNTYHATLERVESIVADFGLGRLNLTVSFGYDSVGNVTSVTDPRGNVSSAQYDNLRRVTQTTAPSPFSYITKYTYNDNGSRTKVERQTSDPGNPWQTSTAAYFIDDLLSSVTSPSNETTTFSYTNLRQLWKTTDPASRVMERAYDAVGRPYTVKDPALDIASTMLYTDNGRLASIKDANNNTTSFDFDGFDRPSKTIYPDASYEQNSSYDASGNVLTYRMRSGNTITNTFDVLNRISTKTPTGMPTVTNTYDLAGRLTKVSTPVVSGDPTSGDFQYFFDTAGRFYQEQYPDGKQVTHQLDANGNATKFTYPDGYFLDRVFDELNRLVDIKLNGSASVSAHFDYDAQSRRTRLTYGANVANCQYSFEKDDDLTSLIQTFSGSAVVFTHKFNSVGELTSSAASDSQCIWHPSVGGTASYGTANSMNQYPTVGGVSQSYNSNGCLTSDGTWIYAFDSLNQLVSANKTGVSASYLYDPALRQGQKNIGGTKTRFIYSGFQRVADYDGTSGSLQTRYVYGTGLDEPIIQVTAAGAISYFHHDRIGNIIATSDGTGVVTNKYKYSPWGESSTLSGTTFGFQGQRYDSETGLHYMKMRYYDPKIGRFLQPDPLGYGDGLNLYRFGNNNPNNFTDPMGLSTSPNDQLHSYGSNGKNDLAPGWGNPANGTPNYGGNNGGGNSGGHSFGTNSPWGFAPAWGNPSREGVPNYPGNNTGGHNNGPGNNGPGNNQGHSFGSNTKGSLPPGWGTPNYAGFNVPNGVYFVVGSVLGVGRHEGYAVVEDGRATYYTAENIAGDKPIGVLFPDIRFISATQLSSTSVIITPIQASASQLNQSFLNVVNNPWNGIGLLPYLGVPEVGLGMARNSNNFAASVAKDMGISLPDPKDFGGGIILTPGHGSPL